MQFDQSEQMVITHRQGRNILRLRKYSVSSTPEFVKEHQDKLIIGKNCFERHEVEALVGHIQRWIDTGSLAE